MSSNSNTSPTTRQGNDRAINLDFKLLAQRLKKRASLLYRSARDRLNRTEYQQPTWMNQFRFTWFRAGLMLIALFVFTQKQVDVTLSVGREGLALGETTGRHMATQQTASNVMLQGSVTGGAQTTSAWDVDQLNESAVRKYISRFEKVAQGEEEKFSVPAPAAMALAIYFSEAGRNRAARQDNNHFGPLTEGRYYENAWMNWRAHSELLDRRFPDLASNSVNYQQWVAALAKTDYSSDPTLSNKVMDIVEKFGLESL